MLRSYLHRWKTIVRAVCVLLLVVCHGVTAETESLELQLTREAWAIDREAFEQQLQAAQNQIRDLSQKLSNQEQTVKSDMTARVDSLDAQLTRVSKERNQVFLENEKLKKDLAQSKEALAAVEALGANRQQERVASQKQAGVIKALSARLEKLVEVSKGRLQEIAALRAENEQLRQEGIALRSAFASSEADKEAMMSALKARLESLQARVDRLNQAASRTAAIELAAQPKSVPQPTAQQPKQTQVASQPIAANQAGAPNPSLMVNQVTPPSFVEWMLGKAVEYKFIVLAALGFMLLLLGAVFVFLKRRSAAQEIPLPEAAELPSPELHAEMRLDPERRMAANDPSEILDAAVDTLVSKIRATDVDDDYRLVEPVNSTDDIEKAGDTDTVEVVDESEVIIPPMMNDHDEMAIDGDELDVIDGQMDDESTNLGVHTSESTDTQNVTDPGEIELTEEAPDQVRDDQSEDIILEVPIDQEITQPKIEPVWVFEENLQSEPKDHSSSLFVFADDASDESGSELPTEQPGQGRQPEKLTSESIEDDSVVEQMEDVPAMAELEESNGPESVETSEEVMANEGVSAFTTQYRDTQISVVIPKKRGKKKSLLTIDEFPSFGGYSKSRGEPKNPSHSKPNHITTDDRESSTRSYGSSSYDEYQLYVSEAFLNPKKPAMRLGDAANFGGYGLGDEKKQRKAAQRRTPKRARGGQRKFKADRVVGFGSNVSPLFDTATRAEPKREHELQQAEPSYDPNSLMAHGGVDDDIKSPLVSIPLSLQTKNVYGTKASDGHGAEVFNEESQPVADQISDGGFDALETSFDHTSDLDALVSNQTTELEMPEQTPKDPLDDILSGAHLEMPENDPVENVDTQSSLMMSEFETVAVDSDPNAEDKEQSIDSLLSMAGHDLSVHSDPNDASAEFHTESVEPTLESWDDINIVSPDLSNGQIDEPVDHSMDFTATIGESGLGSDVMGGASPDPLQSDEFGPALSFGEISASEETVIQENTSDSMSPMDMPENVVHHPTSPGYSVPEVSEDSSDAQSPDASSDSSDPFEPFIRVLWLIETGETKEARLELEGLSLHDSPEVRRMAYDFKERLAKNEANRA
jgi:regulator of replication initiation timing